MQTNPVNDDSYLFLSLAYLSRAQAEILDCKMALEKIYMDGRASRHMTAELIDLFDRMKVLNEQIMKRIKQ